MKWLFLQSAVNYNTTWARLDWTANILQGTGQTQRVGESITVWRIEVFLLINVTATTALPRETVRFVIWREMVPGATVTDYNGLYDADFAATDAVCFGVRKRRNMTTSIAQILYDRPIKLVAPTVHPIRGESTRHYRKVVLNWRKGLRVNYTATNSQAPAAGRQANFICFNPMGEQSVFANFPTGTYQMRLYYTDV